MMVVVVIGEGGGRLSFTYVRWLLSCNINAVAPWSVHPLSELRVKSVMSQQLPRGMSRPRLVARYSVRKWEPRGGGSRRPYRKCKQPLLSC